MIIKVELELLMIQKILTVPFTLVREKSKRKKEMNKSMKQEGSFVY